LHWEVFLLLGDKAVSGRNRETPHQGCQIFIDTIYQNGDNVTNCHTVYQMVMTDIKKFNSKAFQNVPKLGVGFENERSGSPAPHTSLMAPLLI
jgi:hypothetical protein